MSSATCCPPTASSLTYLTSSCNLQNTNRITGYPELEEAHTDHQNWNSDSTKGSTEVKSTVKMVLEQPASLGPRPFSWRAFSSAWPPLSEELLPNTQSKPPQMQLFQQFPLVQSPERRHEEVADSKSFSSTLSWAALVSLITPHYILSFSPSTIFTALL